MGFRFPIVSKTRQALAMKANPEAANQPEALPWILYDTVAWTTAVTTTASYFGTVQGDKTLGNMEGPGQLPDPQYFEIWYWGLDFLLSPNSVASVAVAGPLNDIAAFLHAQRLTFTFNISNKRVGPFPGTFFHASGGPTGYLAITNAAAAQKNEFANNGIFDGGFCVNGAIVIPPKLGFDVTLATAAAPVLQTSPLNVRPWQAGVLHRRVL
jgi:hypothetical protein